MGEAEIRSRLVHYLAGEATLRELDAAVTSVAWDENAPAAARDLANMIALRIGELSSEQCDEAELRAALRPLVTVYTVPMFVGGAPPVVDVRTGSSSPFKIDTSASVSVTPKFAGTQFAAVSS